VVAGGVRGSPTGEYCYAPVISEEFECAEPVVVRGIAARGFGSPGELSAPLVLRILGELPGQAILLLLWRQPNWFGGCKK